MNLGKHKWHKLIKFLFIYVYIFCRTYFRFWSEQHLIPSYSFSTERVHPISISFVCKITINHHRASQSQITLLWHMYNTSYIYADTVTVNFCHPLSASHPEYQYRVVTTTARNLTSNDGNSLKPKSLFISCCKIFTRILDDLYITFYLYSS